MKYTKSHEWVETQGQEGQVGVTHYAQKELGDIVYVELPQVGKLVKKGEAVAVLESTKAAADVYAPVSGKIVAVNHSLQEAPELLNLDPEGKGWLFRVQFSDPQELPLLLEKETYLNLIQA